MDRTELIGSAKKRDPFLDNARFILVTLVVFGHLISPAKDQSDLIYFANNFLGSFRMPALILITGYLSKRFYKDKGRFIEKVTIGVLVPYLIFQSFYSIMNDLMYNHEVIMINIFSPSYAMWFLLSLFFWNMMLFVFTRLKYPILIAFIVGIGAGWLDDAGHYLSVSRTLVFFPFFLIGHYLNAEHFELFKKGKAKIAAVIGMLVSWLILSSFSLYEARTFLLAKYPYPEIADSYLEGTFVRIVFYIVMLLGILAFLPWMPKKTTFFTHLGTRTAYIYILHILFMKIFYALEFDALELQPWFIIAIPVAAIAITMFVSSKYVVFVTRPFIEGRIARPLFKQEKPSKENKNFNKEKDRKQKI